MLDKVKNLYKKITSKIPDEIMMIIHVSLISIFWIILL
jgi:hypothetical protein